MFSVFRFFLLFIFLLIYLSSQAQSIPVGITTPICDGQSISVEAPQNSGYDNIFPCGPLYNSPLSPFLDFYHVVIQSGGTFVFVVTPNGEADYDFGAWKNPNWEDLSLTPPGDIRGSQNDPFQSGVFHIGLSLTETTLCEAPGSSGQPEPGLVKYFDVEPGDEILIAIDRWSQTDYGYTIDFGGDAVLDCTIVGNNFFKCIDASVEEEDFFAEDVLPELEEEFPNQNFLFFSEETQAETGEGNPIEFPFSIDYNGGEPTHIFVRVEDDSGGLIQVVKIHLYLSKFPELLTDYLELDPVCGNTEGIAVIDLTQYEEDLILPEQENVELVFYKNISDYENDFTIDNPEAFEAEDNQLLIASAINTFSGCKSQQIAEIRVIANSKPQIDLSSYHHAVICQHIDSPHPDSLVVETGLEEEQFIFTWYLDGEELPESGPDLEITQAGDYAVLVESLEGCEQFENFTIIEQTPPNFDVRLIKPPFAKGIEIFNVEGEGIFLFKVNDGAWQSLSSEGNLIFENLPAGTHLVYGKDISGCGEMIKTITIMGYPDFFTPNGDGINDFWKIEGLDNQSQAIVFIFDRYGQLLYQMHADSEGWDGTFNGKNMPSNEYWFKIELKNKVTHTDGSQEEIPVVYTGHFVLKR